MIVMVAATVADIFSAHPITDITDVTDINDTLSWIILGPESYSASPGRSSTWTLCPADFRVTISTWPSCGAEAQTGQSDVGIWWDMMGHMRIPEFLMSVPRNHMKSPKWTKILQIMRWWRSWQITSNPHQRQWIMSYRVLVATLELLQVLSAPGVPSQAVASLSSA